MKPIVQISLDLTDINEALETAALALRAGVDWLEAGTPLIGAIPELDSMAVVGVITGIEERFGVSVADDEMDASVFATLGSLVEFVDRKLA